MPKFTFSTDELPSNVPNSARAAAWGEHYEKKLGRSGIELHASPERPLQAKLEIVPVNTLAVASIAGSISRLSRTRSGILADSSDALVLVLNSGPKPWRLAQCGREIVVGAGGSTLYTDGLTGDFEAPGTDGSVASVSIRLSRKSLAAVVPYPEDILAHPIDVASEPLRMVNCYARTILDSEGLSDAATSQSIGNHMIDLIGLALAPRGGAEDTARRGSLRSGRLHTVLGAIKASYRNPGFSIQQVAVKHRVTPRYLQEMLHETGSGFTERVLELRLQHSCELLARADMTHRKVSDIAYSSGFNDLSYFHRCFRRRFGKTPADARSSAH
jgi:AraC-like DNA-binding protein